MSNIYFELTEAFNAAGPVAALASGQAVVFYRIAIMSKDGDWVIRECSEACEHVLTELERRGAHYRLGAPLDIRWLAGGWSSHFEFVDDHRRRVRCDFLSRPPRVPAAALNALFTGPAASARLLVLDVESLILMKLTQRAKDYAVVGELASLLPPKREIAFTTNPDRIIALASAHGASSSRPAVLAAMAGAGRRAVVIALAEEADELQQEDRRRLARYEQAAGPFLDACRAQNLTALPLRTAHARLCDAATGLLPTNLPWSPDDADAQ